ncbi:hypothetical protein CCUS01_01997 [Colletotrichum cuscutae]|uniref:Uncharacterized protein n=1 Tax=Colletotrichum cuscutae TaxID=1209917 RepID=A0AAI9XM31_9PEZI|nr:hypothetical protein CCUS01_01997 [Colletotrichum cuscutae]
MSLGYVLSKSDFSLCEDAVEQDWLAKGETGDVKGEGASIMLLYPRQKGRKWRYSQDVRAKQEGLASGKSAMLGIHGLNAEFCIRNETLSTLRGNLVPLRDMKSGAVAAPLPIATSRYPGLDVRLSRCSDGRTTIAVRSMSAEVELSFIWHVKLLLLSPAVRTDWTAGDEDASDAASSTRLTSLLRIEQKLKGRPGGPDGKGQVKPRAAFLELPGACLKRNIGLEAGAATRRAGLNNTFTRRGFIYALCLLVSSLARRAHLFGYLLGVLRCVTVPLFPLTFLSAFTSESNQIDSEWAVGADDRTILRGHGERLPPFKEGSVVETMTCFQGIHINQSLPSSCHHREKVSVDVDDLTERTALQLGDASNSIPAAGKRYYGGTYKATTKELSESPVRIPPDLRPGHRSRQFRPQSPPFTYIRELMSISPTANERLLNSSPLSSEPDKCTSTHRIRCALYRKHTSTIINSFNHGGLKHSPPKPTRFKHKLHSTHSLPANMNALIQGDIANRCQLARSMIYLTRSIADDGRSIVKRH